MRTSISVAILFMAVVAGGRTASAVPEVCGNGLDDDANGFADNGCWPAASMGGVCESPMSCAVTGDVASKTGGLEVRATIYDS